MPTFITYASYSNTGIRASSPRSAQEMCSPRVATCRLTARSIGDECHVAYLIHWKIFDIFLYLRDIHTHARDDTCVRYCAILLAKKPVRYEAVIKNWKRYRSSAKPNQIAASTPTDL